MDKWNSAMHIDAYIQHDEKLHQFMADLVISIEAGLSFGFHMPLTTER